MSEVSEVLERAADIIERDGWCQGNYSKGRRHCAAGAIAVAEGRGSGVHPDCREGSASRALEALVRTDARPSIGTWNDAPGRTKQEVIDKLREAAEASK